MGSRLSWETGIEKVGFVVFPERCNRGTSLFGREKSSIELGRSD